MTRRVSLWARRMDLRRCRERRQANRVVGGAVTLAVTGLLELGVAVLTGSVGLLGDALHNLSCDAPAHLE